MLTNVYCSRHENNSPLLWCRLLVCINKLFILDKRLLANNNKKDNYLAALTYCQGHLANAFSQSFARAHTHTSFIYYYQRIFMQRYLHIYLLYTTFVIFLFTPTQYIHFISSKCPPNTKKILHKYTHLKNAVIVVCTCYKFYFLNISVNNKFVF